MIGSVRCVQFYLFKNEISSVAFLCFFALPFFASSIAFSVTSLALDVFLQKKVF